MIPNQGTPNLQLPGFHELSKGTLIGDLGYQLDDWRKKADNCWLKSITRHLSPYGPLVILCLPCRGLSRVVSGARVPCSVSGLLCSASPLGVASLHMLSTRNCNPILSQRIVLACFPFRPAPARPRELVGPTPMAPQGRCYKHNLVNSLEEFCSQLLFFFFSLLH